MSNLVDIKRLQLELMKVRTARTEIEFKILERQEEIKRLDSHIKIQEQAEKDIEARIKKLMEE